MNNYIAHTGNDFVTFQTMDEHIKNVELFASNFSPETLKDFASISAILHDIGKYSSSFQKYLTDSSKGLIAKSVDHKFAGAYFLHENFQELFPLAILLQSHNGGLKNPSYFADWFIKNITPGLDENPSMKRYKEVKAIFQQSKGYKDLNLYIKNNNSFPKEVHNLMQNKIHFSEEEKSILRAEEFKMRMIFSSLVDADGLDTENHYYPSSLILREKNVFSLNDLWTKLENWKHSNHPNKTSGIAKLRGDIYEEVLNNAGSNHNLWKLPAPTGSGKTITGLAFALEHARKTNKKRIIIAMPFLTITDQTSKVYKDILGEESVVDHHSLASSEGFSKVPDYIKKFATDNWNATIIVTTTVQLVNALTAAKVSDSRKFHNLSDAIVLIDEAQTLPTHILEPFVDMLYSLTEYNSTIILSTATQPAFEKIIKNDEKEWKSLIKDFDFYQKAFKRVNYNWDLVRAKEYWDNKDIAAKIQSHNQVLTIVNTTKAAQDIFSLLNESEGNYHLSTRMCQAHRKEVVAEVKKRLIEGKTCRLVSTQLVEAGVDFDFPIVLRALAPLDSIIQAAGRCNREGKLRAGQVDIFLPKEHNIQKGFYKNATLITQDDIIAKFDDPTNEAALMEYFNRVYEIEHKDTRSIQEKRAMWDFEYVAENMKVIEDDQFSVIVPFGIMTESEIIKLEAEIKNDPLQLKRILKKLFLYEVKIYNNKRLSFIAQGKIRKFGNSEDIFVWTATYDNKKGVIFEGLKDLENMIL